MTTGTPRIAPAVIQAVLDGYRLSPTGIHGAGHWARVLENGARLCVETGADRSVVTLFAVLHDARRLNNERDPDHGRRGAELAAAIGHRALGISEEGLELLVTACELHADGLTTGDVTVRTCWDADRLDLWRASIVPNDRLLCTPAGRSAAMKRWARWRSLALQTPDFVSEEWGIPRTEEMIG